MPALHDSVKWRAGELRVEAIMRVLHSIGGRLVDEVIRVEKRMMKEILHGPMLLHDFDQTDL